MNWYSSPVDVRLASLCWHGVEFAGAIHMNDSYFMEYFRLVDSIAGEALPFQIPIMQSSPL